MASADDMAVILPLGTDTGQAQIQNFTLSEAEITASVSYGQLKPIIMTMANMANVSEEVQVSTQESVPTESSEPDLTDNMLRNHLLSSKVMKSARPSYTSEVYTDDENGVTYEIVKGGTARGGDRLIDSLGFTYNLKRGRDSKNVMHWWCSVRNSKLRCPAVVIQRGKTFTRGKRKHEHLVGQNTPKPHIHNYHKQTTITESVPSTSPKYNTKKMHYGNEDYRIIRGGSKAGMDLLRDKFGYTFTLKKLCKDGIKRYWICSVRNKYLRCPAMVIQVNDMFMEGSLDHKHMPGCKVPAGVNDVIPKHGIHEMAYEDNDDIDTNMSEFGDISDTHGHNYNTKGGNAYVGLGSPPKRGVSLKQRMVFREKKRKEHPTFLGPSCTINLTKCDKPSCNCKMVHCPFCDPSHFIPAKAGRVQDHLELTHFAHGVQYDDLMIVKCFQDCNAERNFGHYHCVFCFQQILKRNAYARHMLRHMRKMNIPDRLLVLPDSKYPDVINAYGFEIPVCKKVSCQPSRERHYHCPQCQQICKERSLTVNHLWRCLQKKADSGHVSDEEDMMNTVEESQLNLHFSHFKSFNDLPITKCTLPACCGGMYHCRLCPVRQFVPTYRQHLIAHYVTHWKQRVTYKGYNLLKCFQLCEGLDRSFCKVRYHFHCPICCKMILTKGSFVDHIKGCHLFKFGENLLQDQIAVFEKPSEDDANLALEMSTINDNVEYMEDRLTSQALAKEEDRKRTTKKPRWRSSYGGKFRRSTTRAGKNIDTLMKAIKAEITEQLDVDGAGGAGLSDEDGEVDTGNLSDDILGLNIREDEIFELGTVIFSEKLVSALKSAAVVTTVLSKVSDITNTKVTEEDGRYMLCGRLEDLVAAKQLIVTTIQGSGESEYEDQETEPSPKHRKVATKIEKMEEKGVRGKAAKNRSGQVTKNSVKGKKVEESVSPVKRGRGRPKRSGDSFPYSEIKEIIEASKKTETEKRGRGRPPKKLPTPGASKPEVGRAGTKSKVTQQAKTPVTSTPTGRYGTRGIKRNYLEMSAGRVEIKKEVVSDEEVEQDDDELEDQEASEVEETPRTRKGRRGRPRKRSLTPEEVDENTDGEKIEDDEDDFLDDNEQETQELDGDMSADDFDGEMLDKTGDSIGDTTLESPDGSSSKKIVVVSPRKSLAEDDETKPGSKITDSMVQKLRTSNVSTSVPTIAKVGIRTVKVGKRKPNDDEELLEKDLEKAVEEARGNSLHCSLCDDHQSESFSDLTAHLKTFHHVYEPPRCDICEIDFDTVKRLSLHIDRKHGPVNEPATFKCWYEGCGKEFGSQVGLTGHVNKAHLGQPFSSAEKKYECEKCQYKTNSREDLWEHRKVAHNEEIECKQCNMVFVNYQTLKAHNSLKHSDDGTQMCNVCGKEFTSKLSLQRHLKLHSQQLFMCNICHKTIKSRASFNDHMERHKPERERKYRYYCAYCGKGFSVKSNYDDHQNKHTGNKPYKCNLCTKTFGFRSMLKKHKTFVHSSERPFKCGYCMKGFKFMNLLKNHVTIHTNKSQHVCTYCNKIFSTSSTLKIHLKKCGSIIRVNDQPSNMIVMYSDAPQKTATATDTMSEHQVLIGNPTAIIDDSANQVVDSISDIAVVSDTAAMSEPVLAPADGTLQGGGAQQEVEVYACSECNATFGTFQEAESHVLTAHPVVNLGQ